MNRELFLVAAEYFGWDDNEAMQSTWDRAKISKPLWEEDKQAVWNKVNEQLRARKINAA